MRSYVRCKWVIVVCLIPILTEPLFASAKLAKRAKAAANSLTPAMVAAIEGESSLPKTANKKDINAVDFDGNTALMWSVLFENIDIARALLQVPGIEVDKTNPQGMTALMLAADTGQPEFAELLIEAGADIQKRDRVFFYDKKLITQDRFIPSGKFNTLESFYSNLRNPYDYQRLSPQEQYNHDIATTLYKYQAFIGRTPLLIACQGSSDGHLAVVRALLARNANPGAATLVVDPATRELQLNAVNRAILHTPLSITKSPEIREAIKEQAKISSIAREQLTFPVVAALKYWRTMQSLNWDDAQDLLTDIHKSYEKGDHQIGILARVSDEVATLIPTLSQSDQERAARRIAEIEGEIEIATQRYTWFDILKKLPHVAKLPCGEWLRAKTLEERRLALAGLLKQVSVSDLDAQTLDATLKEITVLFETVKTRISEEKSKEIERSIANLAIAVKKKTAAPKSLEDLTRAFPHLGALFYTTKEEVLGQEVLDKPVEVKKKKFKFFRKGKQERKAQVASEPKKQFIERKHFRMEKWLAALTMVQHEDAAEKLLDAVYNKFLTDTDFDVLANSVQEFEKFINEPSRRQYLGDGCLGRLVKDLEEFWKILAGSRKREKLADLASQYPRLATLPHPYDEDISLLKMWSNAWKHSIRKEIPFQMLRAIKITYGRDIYKDLAKEFIDFYSKHQDELEEQVRNYP